ncbi:MAG: hypothetical protein SCALA702_00670 [Melioribacteraceae bacterium]|nr:MAG: hypothetical protein SCALA702_00670 [Melioribacteraceae bacterium]
MEEKSTCKFKAIGTIKSMNLRDIETNCSMALKIEFRDKIKYNNKQSIYVLLGEIIKDANEIENQEFCIKNFDGNLLYSLYTNKETLVFEFDKNDSTEKKYYIQSIEIYND